MIQQPAVISKGIAFWKSKVAGVQIFTACGRSKFGTNTLHPLLNFFTLMLPIIFDPLIVFFINTSSTVQEINLNVSSRIVSITSESMNTNRANSVFISSNKVLSECTLTELHVWDIIPYIVSQLNAHARLVTPCAFIRTLTHHSHD